MSTRSRVVYVKGNKAYGVYVHHDGYPDGVGFVLEQHYQSEKKIRELVQLGDLSILAEKVNPSTSTHSFDTPEEGVTIAYGRDRGETNVGTEEFPVRGTNALNALNDTYDHYKNSDAEWVYVYLSNNKQWYVLELHEDSFRPTKLSSLFDEADEEPKVMKRAFLTKEGATKTARRLRKEKVGYILFYDVKDREIRQAVVSLDMYTRNKELFKTPVGEDFDLIFSMTWGDYIQRVNPKATQAEVADTLYKRVNSDVQNYINEKDVEPVNVAIK